jgi:hypothetical protein
MADNKNKQNEGDVLAFLNSVEHPKRKEDSFAIMDMMKEITGEEPKIWGKSMVGFGSYHYTYASGREGDWFITGFSPRKQNMSLYIMAGFERYDELMKKLGKHKTGKSCLYINKLEDVDIEILKELITASVDHMNETYN